MVCHDSAVLVVLNHLSRIPPYRWHARDPDPPKPPPFDTNPANEMRRGVLLFCDSLPAWCRLNSVGSDGVRVGQLDGKGYGLVAERAFGPGDGEDAPALLTIPSDLVLSADAVEQYAKIDKNFRQLLDVAGRQSHRGDILLYLLVQMILTSPDFEHIEGVISPWTQYFCLLPNHVPVPTMWTANDLELLHGTSLASAVTAKRTALTKEFDDLKAKTSEVPHWFNVLFAEDRVTLQDWILLDALYRSRSLALPYSGECMVPCLDLANHSPHASARFEEDEQHQVKLVLRDGCALAEGQEVTIDYGQAKSAAEMLFSYGFIDKGSNANRIVLPLEPLEDDPLGSAKLYIFRATQNAPTIEIRDHEDGVPTWHAPFAYLLAVNEEDGLQFGVMQETDGSRHLKLFWQEEDESDRAHQVKDLFSDHPLRLVFELRAVSIIFEKLFDHISDLDGGEFASKQIVERSATTDAASRLRLVEKDLLTRMMSALELQTATLYGEDSVRAYLRTNGTDDGAAGDGAATNEDGPDFS